MTNEKPRVFMCHVGIDHINIPFLRLASPILGENSDSPPQVGEFDLIQISEGYECEEFPKYPPSRCKNHKSYIDLRLRTSNIMDIAKAIINDQLVAFNIAWKELQKSFENAMMKIQKMSKNMNEDVRSDVISEMEAIKREIQLFQSLDVEKLAEIYTTSICVHYDPEFENFTYGDYKWRVGLMKDAKKGDMLFFNSRLQLWDKDSKSFVLKENDTDRTKSIEKNVNNTIILRKYLVENTPFLIFLIQKSPKPKLNVFELFDCLRAALFHPDIPLKCVQPLKSILGSANAGILKSSPLYVYDWYVIGYFTIEDIIKLGNSTENLKDYHRLVLNPHFIRKVIERDVKENAWIFVGSKDHSKYFDKAVILSEDLWNRIHKYIKTYNKSKEYKSKYEGFHGCIEIVGEGVDHFLEHVKIS